MEILPDEIPKICRGVKYASRTEMLKHLEQGIEPESMILLRLQERLAAAEARARAAEDRLQSLEKAGREWAEMEK